MSALSPRVEQYTSPQNAPKSPRHYNKFTYSTRRKPENEAEEIQPVSPRSQRRRRGELTEYEALVAGLAPLRMTEDGFCISEDGTVSSRFVTPTRMTAPAIAMVGVPVTVVPTIKSAERGPATAIAYVPTSTKANPGAVLARYNQSNNSICSYEMDPAPVQEVQTWHKFVQIAENDFSEKELADMSWEVIERLLGHYGMINPVEIARVQLQWRRKHGYLPSDSLQASAIEGSDNGGVEMLPLPAYAQRTSNAIHLTRSYNTNGQAMEGVSPRRTTPTRYVPDRSRRSDFSHVGSKIDNGRNRPWVQNCKPRGSTPVRASSGSRGRNDNSSNMVSPPMRFRN